jgi:hypothetical protein
MPTIEQIFTAESQSVFDFLTEDGQGCLIPAYQRPYAWDSQNIARLLEDATLGLERLLSDETSVRFIGSIIAVRGERGLVQPPLDRELPRRVMTIIDGQQRLCTIIILNILLHDKIRQLLVEMAESEDDGILAIHADASDFLGEIAKTYHLDRRGEELNKLYPRVIRAMEDTWARTADTAEYASPVARLIWAYIVHTHTAEGDENEDVEAFEYDAKDWRGDILKGHETLAAVLKYMREQIAVIASGKHELLAIPAVDRIVAENSKIAAELWPHAIPQSVRDYFDEQDEEHEHFDTACQAMRLITLTRYLNHRMAATVIDAQDEDYAFDMFEALNTTGQPLTALETFKPKVIEAEGQAYARSSSRTSLDAVQAFLDRYKRAEERQTATSTLLIPFALSENGHKLEKHLSLQRRYLRDQYAAAQTPNAKRSFLKNLATTATFIDSAWRPRKGADVELLPDEEYSDDVATFCFHALRTLRHEIVLAPLGRFYGAYEAATAANKEAAANEYFAAIKAITGFSMLWRASKGGTANIDSIYRNLMANGLNGGVAFSRRVGNVPAVSDLRCALRFALDEEDLDRDTWIRDAGQAAMYKTGQNVARFLLFAASHDAKPDDAELGMIVKGRRGLLDLLNAQQWENETTLTVEHVAPDAQSPGWPDDVYLDQRTVHRLGNLILLPSDENSVLGNKTWDQKKTLYRMFGATTREEAKRAIAAARRAGFNVGNTAEDLVEESKVLPMCQAISEYDGDWDLDFIEKRSTQLAELAWDTIYPWLQEPPAPRRGRRRR